MLVLTFQVGTETLALDIRRIREVVPRVNLRRITSAPEWLAGVFVFRGEVIPVLDLYRMTGGPECPQHLSSRIILVPRRDKDGSESMFGLLAAEVADIREVDPTIRPLPNMQIEGRVNLGTVIADGKGVLRLLDADRLLPGADWQSLTGHLAEVRA